METEANIPKDILHKLAEDYENKDYNVALGLVQRIKSDRLNVGWIQLSRAVIILAEKDIDKMKGIIDDRYWGDPRDVLMAASTYPGRGNHFGTEPFTIEEK